MSSSEHTNKRPRLLDLDAGTDKNGKGPSFVYVDAAFTPYDETGSVNLAAVPDLAAASARHGASCVLVCGTTGEWPSLTIEERKGLVAAWKLECDRYNLELMVHAGDNNLQNARELAAFSAKIGANSLLVAPPCIFKATDGDQVAEVLGDLSTAAPGLPILYYHFPAMYGINVPVREVLQASGSCGRPMPAGVKFCDTDLVDLSLSAQRLEAAGAKYGVICQDNAVLSALPLGAGGVVTYGFMIPMLRQVVDAYAKRDMGAACAAQRRVHALNDLLSRTGKVAAAREMVGAASRVEMHPPRLPLHPLSGEHRRSLSEKLDSLPQNPGCPSPRLPQHPDTPDGAGAVHVPDEGALPVLAL